MAGDREIRNRLLETTEVVVENSSIYSVERATGILVVMAGMALQWAALHSITFIGTLLPFGEGIRLRFHEAWVVNSLCTFAVFFFLLVVSARLPTLLGRRSVLRCVAVCLSAGIVLLVAGSFSSADPFVFYAGDILIALGTTPLIVLWGEIYRYLNPKGEQLLITLGAIILSVAIYALEIHLPDPLPVVVLAASCLGSVVCLYRAYLLFEADSDAWGVRKTMPAKKSPALFLVCIFAFSIPYNYLRSFEGVAGGSADVASWSSVLSIAVIIMLLVSLAEVVAEHRGMLLVPGFVLLLLSAAMAVHLVAGDAARFAVSAFLYSGYYLFLAMVYLALGSVVAASKTNAVRLFSGAMLANVGGLLTGSFLGELSSWMSDQAVAAAVMAVTYAIFFVGFALLYNRSYSIFRVNAFDEERYSFEYRALSGGVSAVDGQRPVMAAVSHGIQEPSSVMLEAIAAQCNATADRFGLSARECEVLIELVSGKTIASIAADLVLSENTIKAHTKSIYRKLDVHSREELLGFVQSV